MLQLADAKEGRRNTKEEKVTNRDSEGENRRGGEGKKGVGGESGIEVKTKEPEEVKGRCTPESRILVEELDDNEDWEIDKECISNITTEEEKEYDKQNYYEEKRHEKEEEERAKKEIQETENDCKEDNEKIKKGNSLTSEGLTDALDVRARGQNDTYENRGECRGSVDSRQNQDSKVEREDSLTEELELIREREESRERKDKIREKEEKLKREQGESTREGESRKHVEESPTGEEWLRECNENLRKKTDASRRKEGKPRKEKEKEAYQPITEEEKNAKRKKNNSRTYVEQKLMREERSAKGEEEESRGEGEANVRRWERTSKPRVTEDDLEAQEREETRRLWLTELDQEAGRGGQLRASRSTLDLPSSVNECFQDPSFLSSLQARLLSLVGRGSRYHIRRSFLRPVMSLEALRRKVKEARLLLFPHQPSSPTTKTPETPYFSCDQSPSSSTNSGNLFHSVTHPESKPFEGEKGFASLKKYWVGEGSTGGGFSGEAGIGGEEEIELLQQYLSLQQLAISRKHSSQLRKIRDSLVCRKIRSRPCSVISGHVQTTVSPPKLLINADLESESVLIVESNISDDHSQSPTITSKLSSDPDQIIRIRPEPLRLTPVLDKLTPGSSTLSPNHSQSYDNHTKPSGFHRRRPSSLSHMQDPAYWSPASAQPSPTHYSQTPIHTFQPSPSHVQTPKSDRQQLRDFLLDVGFVQYYSLLNRHGYDLATAAHMDALDLAGAGITEPLHRMALKFELELVKQPPKVPEEVPETIEEWLHLLNLDDYTENFHQNGLYCPLAAVGLNKRDLQLMGIYMQGHRKKILLALTGLSQALFGKT